MITNVKEITKDLNGALRLFRNAIKTAKKNLVVEVINPKTAKPARTRKAKVMPPIEGSEEK